MHPADVRPDNNERVRRSSGTPSSVLLPAPAPVPRKATRDAAEQARLTKALALQAAAESEKALAAAKEEASSATSRFLRAEQQLAEERKLRVKESGTTTARLAGLNNELSAAVRHTAVLEKAGRRERRLVFFVSSVAMALAIGLTIFFVRRHHVVEAILPNRPTAAIRSGPMAIAVAVRETSAESQALDRLTRAFSMLPSGSAPAVLREANQRLSKLGTPACSVESAAGEPALLVGRRLIVNGTPGDGPLTDAFSRCADAVERTLDVNGWK